MRYIIQIDDFKVAIKIRDLSLESLYFTVEDFPSDGYDFQSSGEEALYLRVKQQLKEYFAGDREVFDLSFRMHGSPLEAQVWSEILKIPYGKTISYSQLAQNCFMKGKVRVVAAAVKKNRLLLLVPCHRVIGKNGELRGYSGGLNLKRRLLVLEKAVI